jgi:protein-disulfide isomerase
MKFAAAFLLVSFSLLAQNQPAPKPAAKSALDKATLEAYLRYSELWIPQVTVKIDDPKPSTALDGYYDVGVHLTYNGATKDDLYYVSKDGKNIVKGTAYNIDKSPFQGNLDLLKTDQQPSFGAGANAPVTLVVFGDFECPYCQKEEQELRKNIPATFGDKVRVYFADFPLTQIHPWAMKGSIAGRCMYRTGNDAFWNYHDWIYQNQKDITLENFDAKLQEFAKTKGMDAMLLGRCMDDKSTAAEVDKAVALGHELAVSATPTLFLNGRKIESALDWNVLQQLLQIELDHKAAEAKTMAANKAPADEKCCTVEIPTLAGKK